MPSHRVLVVTLWLGLAACGRTGPGAGLVARGGFTPGSMPKGEYVTTERYDYVSGRTKKRTEFRPDPGGGTYQNTGRGIAGSGPTATDGALYGGIVPGLRTNYVTSADELSPVAGAGLELFVDGTIVLPGDRLAVGGSLSAMPGVSALGRGAFAINDRLIVEGRGGWLWRDDQRFLRLGGAAGYRVTRSTGFDGVLRVGADRVFELYGDSTMFYVDLAFAMLPDAFRHPL